MKKLLLIFILLTACTTTPKPEESQPAPPSIQKEEIPRNEAYIQSRLGMVRPINDLGHEERRFNPCDHGMKGACTPQYLTVMHFQLLCRDSEGTVSDVPLTLRPIHVPRVLWKIGGKSGGTRTDDEGFGQVTLISNRSTKGQRLILRIGKQFLGFTASDLSRVVLPQNFCSEDVAGY